MTLFLYFSVVLYSFAFAFCFFELGDDDHRFWWATVLALVCYMIVMFLLAVLVYIPSKLI